MKQTTFKRLAWISGAALAVLLTLAILPRQNYESKGPWDTNFTRISFGSYNGGVVHCLATVLLSNGGQTLRICLSADQRDLDPVMEPHTPLSGVGGVLVEKILTKQRNGPAGG